MFRRLFSRIAVGLPPAVQPLSPPQRLLVVVLVFVFFLVLITLGLAPAVAVGVTGVLGVFAAQLVALLNRGDDLPGPARS